MCIRDRSYEGIAVPGFPNLFSLNSPYAYNGLSFFTTIEGQMKHIARLVGEMRRQGVRSFEVAEQANDAFVADMKQRLEQSVFINGNCATSRSYYFNQHGEATLLRPTSTISGLRRASRFPLKDYHFA